MALLSVGFLPMNPGLRLVVPGWLCLAGLMPGLGPCLGPAENERLLGLACNQNPWLWDLMRVSGLV